MSIQLLFESTGIGKFLEAKKKIVPSFWSSVEETSLTKLTLKWQKFLSKSGRKFKPSSTRQIGGCRYHTMSDR